MPCPFAPKLRADLPPLTDRIRKLPIDGRGYPVPWFVAEVSPGQWDFRIADATKLRRAVLKKLCWVCGQSLGNVFTFVLGPMCCISGTSSEPPSHPDCANWSVRGCPFLTRPNMVRREDELTAIGEENAPGVMIKRNPGATALWKTRSYKQFDDGRGGMLIRVGPCESISWWRVGRGATREEVLESIATGLPTLRGACDQEATAAIRAEAHAELTQQVEALQRLLPA